jgi:secondary thiamine-phosphate synthase enzyme
MNEKFSNHLIAMVRQLEFELAGVKKGIHLITGFILNKIGNLPENGLLHIFLKHTSASIIINENTDPDVPQDIETYMNRLVPESNTIYNHKLEGLDDMPAHIKASLFGQSLTIPISNHSLNLGPWQGIYLCEFRNHGGPRKFVLTILQ